MITVERINPLDYPDWDKLLMACPASSFFHCSAWAKVLEETYGYTPTYFAVFKNGALLSLIPVMEVNSWFTGKRGVSLPFTDYSDAIIGDDIPFEELLGWIADYGKNHGWKTFELRGGNGLQGVPPHSSSYFRHDLCLADDLDETFAGFSASTRRNIRIAMKKGVRVEICHTWDSVKEFYRLNLVTRKKHGLPSQPVWFFKKVYQHLISKDLGFVALASLQGKIVAGAVYLHFGNKAVWKFGASDKKFLRFKPNNIILWEAIKWYSQNGYKSICFGRTELANEGLKSFKEGWGAKGKTEKYYTYDLRKSEFVTASLEVKELYRRVFRRMPLPLLRVAGSLLYRHAG